MQNRTFRYIVIWGLIVASIWLGDRLVRGLWLTADETRAITPRGDLAAFEQTAVNLFDQAAPSVVYIFTKSRAAAGAGRRGGTGSGFIWDGAGHVVTNHHVVDGAERIWVRMNSGITVGAVLLGSAPDHDLAVLRLDEERIKLKPIPVGRSVDLKVGQAVFAIGNPFGLSRTLTTGIISALDRRLPTAPGREIPGVIQTDAAINPGNSGGPLLDSAGRLIGVNTAILSNNGTASGIGFAVPVDAVNWIVPRLIRDGAVPRPGIGVRIAGEQVSAQWPGGGLVVAEVVPGSPADQAGIKGIDRAARRFGDVITAIDGKPVLTLADLVDALTAAGIDGSVEITVMRDQVARRVRVRVVDIS